MRLIFTLDEVNMSETRLPNYAVYILLIYIAIYKVLKQNRHAKRDYKHKGL